MPISEDDIIGRILAIETDADLKASRLLFHGTCEPFDDALKPMGHDNVLWFADNPLIAQTYIPTAGCAAIVSKPDSWRMPERVRPDKHSFWTEFATATMKRALPDLTCSPS